MKKSFKDFCDTVYFHYGDGLQDLSALLEGIGVTEIEVVCFINWAEGMTHLEIADELDLSRENVTDYIGKLRGIFPDLFNLTEPPTLHSYDPKKHDEHIVRKF